MTGKLLWVFHTIPRPGEFGFDIAGTHKNIGAWLDRVKALPGWKHPYELMPGYPPVLA